MPSINLYVEHGLDENLNYRQGICNFMATTTHGRYKLLGRNENCLGDECYILFECKQERDG